LGERGSKEVFKEKDRDDGRSEEVLYIIAVEEDTVARNLRDQLKREAFQAFDLVITCFKDLLGEKVRLERYRFARAGAGTRGPVKDRLNRLFVLSAEVEVATRVKIESEGRKLGMWALKGVGHTLFVLTMFRHDDHGSIEEGGVTVLGTKDDLFTRDPGKEEDGIFQLFSTEEDLMGAGIRLFFGKNNGFVGGLSGDVAKILKDGGLFRVEVLVIEMIESKIDLLLFWNRVWILETTASTHSTYIYPYIHTIEGREDFWVKEKRRYFFRSVG
jgi:hypothetical protein